MKVERIIRDVRESVRNILRALDSGITAEDNMAPTRAEAGAVLTSIDPAKKPVWALPGSIVPIDGDNVTDDDEDDSTTPPAVVSEQRVTATYTTPIIANGVSDLGQISMSAAGGTIYQMSVSHFSRVRLYQLESLQLSDLTRLVSDPPVNGTLVSEVVFDDVTGLLLYAPSNVYYNADSPHLQILYITVENRSGADAAITVSIVHRPEER